MTKRRPILPRRGRAGYTGVRLTDQRPPLRTSPAPGLRRRRADVSLDADVPPPDAPALRLEGDVAAAERGELVPGDGRPEHAVDVRLHRAVARRDDPDRVPFADRKLRAAHGGAVVGL